MPSSHTLIAIWEPHHTSTILKTAPDFEASIGPCYISPYK